MSPRRRRSSRLDLVYCIVVLGILVGGSAWLDREGTPVIATVSGKHEEVTVHSEPQGDWTRWYRLGVTFPTEDGAPGTATVTVPRARFDSLRVGGSLAIRYLPAFPLLARTTDRSTGQVMWDLASAFVAQPFLMPLLTWLAAGAAALWLMARVSTVAVIVAGLVWVAAAFSLLFPEPPAVRLGPTETTARVEAVRLVTKAPERRTARPHRSGRIFGDRVRRLAMPYQVVQFRLAVPGRPDSVLAVDAVDSGSVAGLTVGATLPVRYDPRTPREARLAVGERTFRERNRYHFLVPMIGVGALGTLGAWGWRARRRGKTSTGAHAQPATHRSPTTEVPDRLHSRS